MKNEVSLVIQNPVEGNFLKAIEWNKQEFLDIVSGITAQYQGLTYTEDQIKEAKADRATLNSMKKAISDRRIQVKNEIMKPYLAFEEEVKEVVAVIEEPILMIDSQIKAYEEKVKKEKKTELYSFFESITEGIEIIVFETVFEPRYLNATFSLKKAKDSIQEKVDRVKADLKTIENMEEDVKFIAKNVYSQTLDLSKAMMEVTRVQEIKRREEEEKARREEETRRREEEKRQAEEAIRMEEERRSAELDQEVLNQEQLEMTKGHATEMDTDKKENNCVETEIPIQEPVVEVNKLYKASFTVKGTREQILALKQYMIDNNIEFGSAK